MDAKNEAELALQALKEVVLKIINVSVEHEMELTRLLGAIVYETSVCLSGMSGGRLDLSQEEFMAEVRQGYAELCQIQESEDEDEDPKLN